MSDLLISAASTLGEAGYGAAKAAMRIAKGLPNVKEMVQDTVERTKQHASVRAGAAVVKTASELLGTIVDLFA